MKIDLPADLVADLQREYPGCVPSKGAMQDLVVPLLRQHLALNSDVRSRTASVARPAAKVVPAKAETPKRPKDLSNCACDWTAHCPVHGSRAFNKDSYIAQP